MPVPAVIPWFRPDPITVYGPVKIEPFGIMVALGIYLALGLSMRAARRQGLDPRPIGASALWAVLGGVLVGHLVHVLAYHPEELTGPLALLRVWDGLSSLGGLFGGVAATLLWFRRHRLSLPRYADAFALGLAPGWGVARIGCFLVHDHPGARTDFALAVAFPDGPRHDLGLYDALLLFAITAVLHAVRSRLQGRLLALLALLYGLGRFGADFLRAADVPYPDARYLGLTPAQYACLLLMAWGVWRLATGRPRPASAAPSRGPAADGAPPRSPPPARPPDARRPSRQA